MSDPILDLLLAAATAEEQRVVRAVAERLGLLWHCESCGTGNAHPDTACAHCHCPADPDRPTAPELTVTLLVSAFTDTTVAVYTDPDHAERAAAAVNAAHGDEVVRVGRRVDHDAPYTGPHARPDATAALAVGDA